MDNLILKILLIYLLAINIIAFAAYGIDKLKAKKGAWRISEATLLFMAFIGGSVGALAGMRIFRHKTQHASFRILVPCFLILHVILIVLAYTKWLG